MTHAEGGFGNDFGQRAYAALAKVHTLPDIDPAVSQKDWGVHLQPPM